MSLTGADRRSKVAQWWSTRLLTDRLWVRVPPLEPIFFDLEGGRCPPLKSVCQRRRSGGIGRHAGLKIPWVVISVPVRPRSPAPNKAFKSLSLEYIQAEMPHHRGVEQLVARRAHNPEVVGSNPSPATMNKTLKSQRFQGSFIIYGFSLFRCFFSYNSTLVQLSYKNHAFLRKISESISAFFLSASSI